MVADLLWEICLILVAQQMFLIVLVINLSKYLRTVRNSYSIYEKL